MILKKKLSNNFLVSDCIISDFVYLTNVLYCLINLKYYNKLDLKKFKL